MHLTFFLNFLNVFRTCVWWTFGKFSGALRTFRRVGLSANRQSPSWRISEAFLLLPQTHHRTQTKMPSEITSLTPFSLLSAFGESKDGKKDKMEKRRRRNIMVIALCTINLIWTPEAMLSGFCNQEHLNVRVWCCETPYSNLRLLFFSKSVRTYSETWTRCNVLPSASSGHSLGKPS